MNGPNNEALCPTKGCSGELYLTLTSNIPLYTVDPPWPGAGSATYEPSDAVSQGWEVVCTEGHTVWHHVDQIRADNAAGLTDDDETCDYAPRFRIDALMAGLAVSA